MDEIYFLGRMHASLAMARNAASSAARLVHLDLAGRYSVAAAQAGTQDPPAAPKTGARPVSSLHGNDNHLLALVCG